MLFRSDQVFDFSVFGLAPRDVPVHGFVEGHVEHRGHHGVDESAEPQCEMSGGAQGDDGHPQSENDDEGYNDTALEPPPIGRHDGSLSGHGGLAVCRRCRWSTEGLTKFVDGDISDVGGVAHGSNVAVWARRDEFSPSDANPASLRRLAAGDEQPPIKDDT